MTPPREITYTDELLADGSVHRAYDDGRREWRRRGFRGVVHWHDDTGTAGSDELLGERIIKRVLGDGTVTYGRDIGYGRTVWGRGETVMVNRTSVGGRVGVLLGTLGVAVPLLATQLPPLSLTSEQEEALRQEQARQASGSGDSGGGGDGDLSDSSDSSDWDDPDGDGWSDDDFG